MGIKFYGMGNWGLPELGITEMFGGKKSSLSSAKTNQSNLQSYLGEKVPVKSATPAPKPITNNKGIITSSVAPSPTIKNKEPSKPKNTGGRDKTPVAKPVPMTLSGTTPTNDYVSGGGAGGGGGSSWGDTNPITPIDIRSLGDIPTTPLSGTGTAGTLDPNQLAWLDTQREWGLEDLKSSLSGVLQQIEDYRASAQDMSKKNVSDLYSNASDITRSNRNALRALGILGSSAAGRYMSQPTQQADMQAEEVRRNLGQYLSQLKDQWKVKEGEYKQAVDRLNANYEHELDLIKSDDRYTEDEKAVAIDALDQALATQKDQLDQTTMSPANMYPLGSINLPGYVQPQYEKANFYDRYMVDPLSGYLK